MSVIWATNSAHLKADMAVREQWSFHLNNGGLLVSTNQLDGRSTDTRRLICQSLSGSNFKWVENFGQGVKGTAHNTHTHRLLNEFDNTYLLFYFSRNEESKTEENKFESESKFIKWANVSGKIIENTTIKNFM